MVALSREERNVSDMGKLADIGGEFCLSKMKKRDILTNLSLTIMRKNIIYEIHKINK